ncbi:hypothetical protein LZ32DRAFT_164639 [Colletotrichum eremochloae]|nr:hypothetical protein LZ32DRAFT_164639 [Colletotrichum eremochloae]
MVNRGSMTQKSSDIHHYCDLEVVSSRRSARGHSGTSAGGDKTTSVTSAATSIDRQWPRFKLGDAESGLGSWSHTDPVSSWIQSGHPQRISISVCGKRHMERQKGLTLAAPICTGGWHDTSPQQGAVNIAKRVESGSCSAGGGLWLFSERRSGTSGRGMGDGTGEREAVLEFERCVFDVSKRERAQWMCLARQGKARQGKRGSAFTNKIRRAESSGKERLPG